jgi:ubiquinol-cytochrome c reductase cytochrome c subunit
MRHSFIVLAGCAAIVVAGTAMAQTAAPSGDAANGKTLLLADGCYQCHGTVGQGSRGTGPRLAPKPLPFDAFAKQVREPVNTMPPYTKMVLSDQQLADIYAYLNTVPPPPDPKDAAILNH